jgi:hypothetical protein
MEVEELHVAVRRLNAQRGVGQAAVSSRDE